MTKMKISALALCAALLVSAAAAPGALASGEVYVNGEPYPAGLEGSWVLGSGGLGQLGGGGVYVMTGDGLVQMGSDTPAAPEGDPEHLEVSGTIDLPYDKLRVALYYYDEESSLRKGTLDTANLENAVGSGFSFGYYDAERVFHAVGETDETAITMAKDMNVTLEKSGVTVGCYHILLPESYQSFAEAKAAAAQYADGFPAYYNGVYRVLYGDWTSSAEAQQALSASGGSGSVYTASGRCVVVTRTYDGKILFEFDCGSSRNLAVEPKGATDEALTWFKGFKYHGGFEYIRRTGDKLTVINVVDIEDYVMGVIPYEMSSSWPLEALKAQAMCARTYAATHFNSLPTYQADVTNDTYSQAYLGDNATTEYTDSAVLATAGLYITYNGELINAMYSSADGGATENSENVMYSAVPYLKGKVDPYEAAADDINYNAEWSVTLSGTELASAVNGNGYSLGAVTGVETTLSPTGNVIGITFKDASGASATFEKSGCYNFVTGSLGLKSIHFEAVSSASGFTFNGSGWGHSVGMSQYGAYAMANTYGFTYDQIINFYYTGVALSRAV